MSKTINIFQSLIIKNYRKDLFELLKAVSDGKYKSIFSDLTFNEVVDIFNNQNNIDNYDLKAENIPVNFQAVHKITRHEGIFNKLDSENYMISYIYDGKFENQLINISEMIKEIKEENYQISKINY